MVTGLILLHFNKSKHVDLSSLTIKLKVTSVVVNIYLDFLCKFGLLSKSIDSVGSNMKFTLNK